VLIQKTGWPRSFAFGDLGDDELHRRAGGQPITQEPELFKLSDFTKMWNPDWILERAGFGGGGGGIAGIRGDTYLDGDTLSIFPRDEVRGALLRRSVQLSSAPSLDFDAGVDPGRTWRLEIFVNNDKVLSRLIQGNSAKLASSLEHQWEHIHFDLSAYKNQSVVIRLYDLILVPGHEAGNSYWRKLEIQ